MVNYWFNRVNERLRRLAVKYAWSFIGTWYSWGGDDPMAGFDCSRFTGELLKSVGKLKRSQIAPTAQGQFNMFKDKKVDIPYKGCLVFWHSSSVANKIVHVEFCIDDKHTIGASGGGSRTKTKEDAIRDNAFIKVRRWDSRRLIAGFVDPFK